MSVVSPAKPGKPAKPREAPDITFDDDDDVVEWSVIDAAIRRHLLERRRGQLRLVKS